MSDEYGTLETSWIQPRLDRADKKIKITLEFLQRSDPRVVFIGAPCDELKFLTSPPVSYKIKGWDGCCLLAERIDNER